MTQDREQNNRWLNTRKVEGDSYDSTYVARAQAGENVHGEVDFVQGYAPRTLLDAGCGTGRVGIEAARRSIEVVGVDIDPQMLATAQCKAPDIEWHLGDIATIELGRRFDAIVMAGNVMIFLAPGTEGQVLRNMAAHLAPQGYLIAGFQLSMGYLDLADYDRLAQEAGLELWERFSTWDREPFNRYGHYAVSAHRHKGS